MSLPPALLSNAPSYSTPQRINQETLTAFQSFISLNNTLGENVATPARPTQAINGRDAVLRSSSTPRSSSTHFASRSTAVHSDLH